MTARPFRVPTDAPEADGTFSWSETTLIVAEVEAGGMRGLGYSYTDAAAAELVSGALGDVLVGEDAFAIPHLWRRMVGRVRNIGWRGLSATAISALDVALWDLKAKLLGVPLATLLGPARDAVPIYGSGGFTSYTEERLRDQLARWVTEAGCRWVKMKIGADAETDLPRVAAAREAIGDRDLFVDANGACTPKIALALAEPLADLGVTWFEEPVSSDDLAGLRLLRDRAPAAVEIAAGEYGYDMFYFRRMLEAGAVDVLQIDATRCCGITGFQQAAALADAHGVPISAHTAPALHLHVCAAAPRVRHVEWFHDHARIEAMLFDGAPVPRDGAIAPDRSRPGLGLALREREGERYAA